MKKTLLTTLIIATSLLSRENPFEPVIKEYSSPVFKERKKEYKPFSFKTLSFPSKARVLKEICIKYQNVDGSIEEKRISIDREIDWQKPLILTNSPISEEKKNPSANKKLSEKTRPERKKAEKKEPRENKTVLKINPFCTLSMEGKKIFIKTSDKKIRSFMLVSPYKIVLDFKNPKDVESKTFKIKNPHIKKIVLGNHKGYYRIVFELKGHYGFTIKKYSKGYILSLK